MKTPSIRILTASILLLACLPAAAASKAPVKAWTDPAAAPREDPDFAIQGEYAEATAGAQVIALGDGRFDTYLLEGGLPGAGWTPGKARTVLHGGRQGDEVTPILNPCFVIRGWGGPSPARLKIGGEVQVADPGFRQGIIRDTDGTETMVIWVRQRAFQRLKYEIH